MFKPEASFTVSLAIVVLSVFASIQPAFAQDEQKARYAASYPNLELQSDLDAVLDAGFDVNTPYSSPGGWTLLHFAAYEGYATNVRYLLDRGADPTLLDDQSRSALDVTSNVEVRAILQQAMPVPHAPVELPVIEPTALAEVMAQALQAVPPPVGAPVSGDPTWDPFGTYQVGDHILYAREGGKTWLKGSVKQVGGASGYYKDRYLVMFDDGYEDWFDPREITSVERQPYWTDFFVGDWRLSERMSMVMRVESGEVYRVFTGGLRLPPLRIQPDGSFIWVTSQYGGGEELVHGRWEPNPHGPGLILRKGELGFDWLMHTVSTSMTHDAYGVDYIHLSSDATTSKEGFRLP